MAKTKDKPKAAAKKKAAPKPEPQAEVPAQETAPGSQPTPASDAPEGDQLVAGGAGNEPEAKHETVSATPSATGSQPLELIVDPLEQKVVDNDELIHEALVAVDEALTSEEEAHAPDMMAARLLFQSSRYSSPFRFLIGLAYAAGHGKKPLA